MRCSSPDKTHRIAFAGILLIGANLRAPITSVGPVLPAIQRDLHLDGPEAGLLNALPLLVFALFALVAPTLGRHRPERTLGWGLFAILIGTVLRSLPIPGALWIGTGMLSAGIAFGNVLLPGLVKREFPARAASLIGVYASAMAVLAGVAAGLAIPIERISVLNWRWSIGVWAMLALIALIAWSPQLGQNRQHGTPAVAPVRHQRSPWGHAIGWQVSIFFATQSLVFYSIIDWFTSYAASHGISPAASGLYLLVYQMVAICTNLGTAPLIRRSASQITPGLMCGVLLVIGTSGLLGLPQLSWLWLVVAGLGAGMAMVLGLSLFTLRTTDHQQAAALSGMAQFIGYLGAASGPFLVGVLHDMTGSWTMPLRLLIAAGLCTAIFGVCAGRNQLIG